MAKQKSVSIASYLVAKDGETKYLKIQCSPKADKATKVLVKKLIKLLGSDVLYVNLFDKKFREKYEVPDFVKGRVALPIDDSDVDEDDETDETEESEEEEKPKSKKKEKASKEEDESDEKESKKSEDEEETDNDEVNW